MLEVTGTRVRAGERVGGSMRGLRESIQLAGGLSREAWCGGTDLEILGAKVGTEGWRMTLSQRLCVEKEQRWGGNPEGLPTSLLCSGLPS